MLEEGGTYVVQRLAPQAPRERMKRLMKTVASEFDLLGVTRVETVAAFAEPFQFWVWPGTDTDADRDRLRADPLVLPRVQELAADEGLDSLFRGLTVESRQAVDRDYGDSWFLRLR